MESFRQGRGAPLCVAGLDPVPPLVLAVGATGDRHFHSPLAGSETECISSSQIDPCGSLQSEGMWDQTPIDGPVLAIPDMVLGVDFHGGANPVGRFQTGPTVFFFWSTCFCASATTSSGTYFILLTVKYNRSSSLSATKLSEENL